MSDTSCNAAKKPMEQPNSDLSAMGQLSVTEDSSNETSPSLSDMPVDVVTLITEKLNFKQHLKLRKVCKSLRALVDKLKPACKSIKVEHNFENVIITFNNHSVIYSDYEDERQNGVFVVRHDFEKVAVADLAITLGNPKLQLGEFDVVENVNYLEPKFEKFCNEIRCALESLNHQVSVKQIDFSVLSPSSLLSILPYCKPGVLNTIFLDFKKMGVNWRMDPIEIDQIARLDQWKQAEHLKLINPSVGFPMEYATHFKRFSIQELDIDHNKFDRIRDFLSELGNLEQCTLWSVAFHMEPNLIYQYLGEPISSNATEEIFHYPIPDSDYYLEFEKLMRAFNVKITKKKRENS